MKLSINKNQVSVILATVLIVVSLVAVYVFFYLPYNEQIIQERRFRSLQNIDRNIHEKIDNSVALLGNLLDSYSDSATNRGRETYISNSKENFEVTSIDSIPRTDWLKDKDSLRNSYVIDVHKNTGLIKLTLYKEYIRNRDTLNVRGTIQFSFEQFISGLLQSNVFDQYIIFSDNKPVYETFPAGIEEIRKDSLLGIRNGIAASGMREFNISGKDYKIFLQPVRISSKEAWTIGGLLSSKQYYLERNQLPPRILILLLIIVFGAMLLFPWIRLFSMGNKDRLTVMDGILSVIVAMLLMSLLFLTFFTYNANFRVIKDLNSRKILADKISTAFIKEIDTMYHKLYSYDTFFANHQTLNKDIISLDSMPRYYDRNSTKIPDTLAGILKGMTKDSSIRHLFWLDKNGKEIRNWNTNSFIAPHGNFNNRAYFKKIVENDPYYLAGYPAKTFDTSKKFYLDQIISRTSTGFTTILSLPSNDGNGVAAVSFKVKSLEDMLLPQGYMFAMIDNSGRVLYHSVATWNLNESLQDEFTGNGRKMLTSALQSHTGSVFTTEYFGREYIISIQPLPYLPYYVLVFGDVSHKETRDMEIFSFSFIMLLLFFLLLALELFTIFFVSAKRSFFKRQLFNTGWVGPRVSCKREYLVSTLMNVMIIALLISFFRSAGFLVYLFILLFSATTTSLFLILLFAKRYKAEKNLARKYKMDAARSLIIIILLIDFVAFLLLEPGEIGLLFSYESVAFLIGLFIYSNSDSLFDIAKDFKVSAFTQKWKKILFPVFWKWDHINSFSLAALTRLVITSGIPVVFFYISSYNYEQNIGIRYKQTEYAGRLLEKLNGDYDTSHRFADTNGVYMDNSWINKIELVERKDVPVTECSEQDRRTLELLGSFRIHITKEAIAERDFYKNSSDDSLFRFNNLLQDAISKDSGSVIYRQTSLPGKYLKISSTNLNYSFPPFLKSILFWLLLVLSLFIFYFIIYYVIRKLFALKTPDLSLWKELDEKLITDNNLNHLLFVIGLPGAEKKAKIIQQIKDKKIRSLDGDELVYNEKDESKNTQVTVVDLVRIPESENGDEKTTWKDYAEKILKDEYKIIIVNHFEYNIQDTHTNQYKLNFLERLMQKEVKSKIIILSTIHPVAFLDSVFSQSLKEKTRSDIAQDKSVPGQDLERWHVLLGHYRIALLSLEPKTEVNEMIPLPQYSFTLRMKDQPKTSIKSYLWTKTYGPDGCNIVEPHKPETEVKNLLISKYKFELKTIDNQGKKRTEELIIDFNKEFSYVRSIYDETMRTHFLHRMRHVTEVVGYDVRNKLKSLNENVNADEMVFKLQVTAHYFYMYMWQSLTKEEKLLLYDLAEDDLVNPFDDYNLSMLIAKGVIVRQDGTLRIFNKGFRNFILTAIGNTELMKIKDQISDKGNWGKLKTPLTIIVVAILAFLMASQEEAYSRMFTYIGGLTTAIAAIFGLLSKFKGSSNSGQ
jgi:hypothetical protein